IEELTQRAQRLRSLADHIDALVAGEKIWETARKSNPDYKVANICWWYAMGAPSRRYGGNPGSCHADDQSAHFLLRRTSGKCHTRVSRAPPPAAFPLTFTPV
ncbi:hypothetical protein ACWGM4_20780, partial [Streptomyces albidoflavus]